MTVKIALLLSVLPALSLTAPAARAGQYTAVDLYPLPGPPPSFDSPAFGGQFVTGSVLYNSNGSSTDLTPDGYDAAELLGTDGIHQFGSVDIYGGFGALATAAVWSGSAASVQPLDMTGLIFARVYGRGGGQSVGTGDTVADGLNANHALLWNGLTGQPIDLNPTKLGFTSCFGSGAGGGQQVGHGYMNGDAYGHTHALLWTGSADSAVDLTPTKLTGNFASAAVATDGRQQVGNGVVEGGLTHALLWSGTGDSAIDLNPSGFEVSYAVAVADGKQVGVGAATGGTDNALLWSSAPDSVVNLQQFLTTDFTISSAHGIDDAGDVFGVAFNSSDQQWHAIEWVPVPEPASMALLVVGGMATLGGRRRLRTQPLAHLVASVCAP